jgi:hypothetical protein
MLSTTPAAVGVHLPRLLESEQVWHAPLQALSQQTPSTQKFEAHSVAAVQAWPGPRRPQLPLVQALPVTHWSLPVQMRTHSPLVASHFEGLHEMATPGTQVPSPSQVLGGTNWPVASHIPSAQTVSAGYFAQAPCPLQTPL